LRSVKKHGLPTPNTAIIGVGDIDDSVYGNDQHVIDLPQLNIVVTHDRHDRV